MNGWIILHKKFSNWGWYQNSEMVHLFLHFLLKANYEPGEWQGQKIERGQFITGRNKLSAETGISTRKIRTCINRLKTTNEIAIKTTNRFSLITIINYDLYQEPEKKRPSKRPSNPPTNDQQVTTTKEYKEDKEKKKILPQKKRYAEFVSMTPDELKKIAEEHGTDFAKQCVKVLDNYKGSTGKKYKSDYRAILSWVIDRVKQDMKKIAGTTEIQKDQIKNKKRSIAEQWMKEKEKQ